MLCLLALGCQGDVDGSAPGIDASSLPCAGVAGETIRWIVPFSPGGGHDMDSRLLEPYLEDAIGAEIVVENRAGAGGRVGSRVIRDAEPDGRTLGIIGATALLIAEQSAALSELHPVNNFTVLGRIATENQVWVTGPLPRYARAEDMIGSGEPILFGITDVGASSFVFASAASEVLGLDIAYVAGYAGSREYSLGLIRGEIDVGSASFESVRDYVEAGDLRPILQISNHPVSDHPSLRDVPVLGGGEGLAARIAREQGRDPASAIAQVDALADMAEAGRLVVAPYGLSRKLGSCLSDRLAEVVRSPGFVAAARRARRVIAFEDPAAVAARLESTANQRASLASVFLEHIQEVRGGGPD
jgi:tripartite-type tricarboxylate transporter receptor subunit TctC